MHNVEKKIGWDQAIPTYKGWRGAYRFGIRRSQPTKGLADLKNVSSAYPPKIGKIYGTITFWITVNVPKME